MPADLSRCTPRTPRPAAFVGAGLERVLLLIVLPLAFWSAVAALVCGMI